MGSVSTPALAVAVADAGGVGSITAMGFTAAELDKVLAGMAAQTTGVLAANFLTEDIDREAVEAAAARVRIVDFLPGPTRTRHWSIRRIVAARWPAGRSVQLTRPEPRLTPVAMLSSFRVVKPGGHIRGDSPLRALLESVLGQLDLPVLAAGGIGDGRSFAAVLDTGAAGARVGTRFVATTESGAHPAYKQAVADAVAGSTEITHVFSVCPLCATVPRARVLRSCIRALRDLAGDTAGETTVGGQRIALSKGHGLPPGAAATGLVDAMAMYAGESAARVPAVEPVAQVIQSWRAAAGQPG